MKRIEEIDYKSVKGKIETLPDYKKELCNSLLNQIVFMEITLKELQKETNEKGVVVPMCQGAYNIERNNPALTQYSSMIKNYNSCIKQLNDMLPDEEIKDISVDDFINEEY